jgi:hypothetical protein
LGTSGIQRIMRKAGAEIVQVLDLLRSSHQRLLVSHALNRDTRDCLKRTKLILETSRQLILRSDELVERIRPSDLAKTQCARSDDGGVENFPVS